MPKRNVIAGLAFLISVSPAIAAAQFLEVCPVPEMIADDARSTLEDRRDDLLTQQISLVASGERFNSQCRNVEEGSAEYQHCVDSFDSLEHERTALNALVNAHCLDIENQRERIAADDLFRKLYRENLDDYSDLQERAAAKDWPGASQSGFALALLKMTRGYYQQAKDMLRIVDSDDKSDPLVDELDSLLSERMIAAHEPETAGLLPTDLAADSLEDKNRAAHVLTLKGATLVGQGDFDSALTLLKEARMKASGLAGSQSALTKAIVWVRQLRAAARERIAPGKYEEAYKTQRAQASAEQAWQLGHALALGGQQLNAIHYYDEAKRYFDGANRPIARVVAEQMQAINDGRFKKNSELLELMTAPKSRADALLDALEYGKGDWQKSLTYLSVRRRLLPDDPILRDTENYLQGITVDR